MNAEFDVSGDAKGAAVKFPPPIIFILLMGLAYGIERFVPLAIGQMPWLVPLGLALVLAALAAIFYISRIFNRAQTHIEPWKPTSSIITTGIYAWSRNPIYLLFCVFTVGMGCLLNSIWVLLSFLPSAYLVLHIAIKPEEAYLERKFGQEYLDYKARVRRWL